MLLNRSALLKKNPAYDSEVSSHRLFKTAAYCYIHVLAMISVSLSFQASKPLTKNLWSSSPIQLGRELAETKSKN